MNRKRASAALAVVAAVAAMTTLTATTGGAIAAVKTEEIPYKQGDRAMKGFVAYDDAVKGPRPGVLVIHEWWGHNDHARKQAERLAQAGYVAFALDMYGEGKVARHPEEASAFMTEAMKNQPTIVARFDAGLAQLTKHPAVDPEKVAAVGYCFGGTVALGMARAGADLDAVAAVHAGLAPTGAPAERGAVKARILVLTGGSDPNVPKEQVRAFMKEMKAARAQAKLVTYPKAKHGFTNPEADRAGLPALAYDADADQRSWKELTAFLKSVFRTAQPEN